MYMLIDTSNSRTKFKISEWEVLSQQPQLERHHGQDSTQNSGQSEERKRIPQQSGNKLERLSMEQITLKT
jgi:hypothetical protein